MKENSLNRQSSVMITCLLSICLLMVLSYIGISNTRVTYSATYECPDGYGIEANGKCYEDGCTYYSNQSSPYKIQEGQIVATGSSEARCYNLEFAVDSYVTEVNFNCYYESVNNSSSSCRIKCDRKVNCSVKDKVLVDTDNGRGAGCYTANYRMHWFTDDPGEGWVKDSTIGSQSACPSGCIDGYVEDDDENCIKETGGITYTITFKNGNTTVATKSCKKATGSTQCLGSDGKNGVGILAPGAVAAPEGKEFTGWGNSGCTDASYGSSHWFDQVATSATYYACFKDKEQVDEDEDNISENFDATKCTYVSANVTRDQRYLNCKYANISYVSTALTTAANVKACCQAKGYTWVTSNFASGYEYCIYDCQSDNTDDTPSNPGGTPNTPNNPGTPNTPNNPGTSDTPSSSTPSTDTGNNGGNIDDNPKTGSIAIFIVWIIALATLGYAFWYFKKVRFE